MSYLGASRNIVVICENPRAYEEVKSIAASFGICSHPLPAIIKQCCLTNIAVLKGPDEFIDGETVVRLRDAMDEVFGFNSAILHGFNDGRNAVSCFEIFPDTSYMEQVNQPK